MEYREIREAEIDQVWQIDRTEYVESSYIYDNGKLVEKIIDTTFEGWPPGEDRIYGPILKDCYRRGGFFWGAFEDGRMVAVVVLESKWIGKNADTLQLKFLHIDRAFRKQGIGRILFEKALERAQHLQAKRIYVSSCENKNTVEFYRHMGCRITGSVDPELYRLEPNDIHMEFIFNSISE